MTCCSSVYHQVWTGPTSADIIYMIFWCEGKGLSLISLHLLLVSLRQFSQYLSSLDSHWCYGSCSCTCCTCCTIGWFSSSIYNFCPFFQHFCLADIVLSLSSARRLFSFSSYSYNVVLNSVKVICFSRSIIIVENIL